jgi:hypothetical protein
MYAAINIFSQAGRHSLFFRDDKATAGRAIQWGFLQGVKKNEAERDVEPN